MVLPALPRNEAYAADFFPTFRHLKPFPIPTIARPEDAEHDEKDPS